MSIDPVRAREALSRLTNITPAQRQSYEETIAAGMSYIDLMSQELGADSAEDYVAEEMAQHFILTGRSFDPEETSVPEFLLLEDNTEDEPWHAAGYSAASAREKFSQEAAEPWHESLRKAGIKPDARVAAYFAAHPEWGETTRKIREEIESAEKDDDWDDMGEDEDDDEEGVPL